MLDSDYRAEAGNGIHVRSFEVSDELAGVAGHSFHVSSLTFSVNGVEGKG